MVIRGRDGCSELGGDAYSLEYKKNRHFTGIDFNPSSKALLLDLYHFTRHRNIHSFLLVSQLRYTIELHRTTHFGWYGRC